LFNISPPKNHILPIFSIDLDYSQAEVAADARHRVRSCGPPPRVPCNEADAVRSACLYGKKMAIKMKVKTNKNISAVIFLKSRHILEIKTNK
jgi:hypothetical protein